jgi:transposase
LLLRFDRFEVFVSRRKQDPKTQALAAERSLNPRADAVRDERFADSEFFDSRDLVQVKYEMVRSVRADGQSVAASARSFGFSRPAYYAAAAALDEQGLAGLIPERPGPRGAHKLTEQVVAFAVDALADVPSLSAAGLAEQITTRFGIRVHPRSVQRAIAREKERKR